MLTIEHILEIAKSNKELRTKEIAREFDVSTQYVNRLLKGLVVSGRLIKIGSTRSARYVSSERAAVHPEWFPGRVVRVLKNINLEEHLVLADIERNLPPISKLRENIRSVFTYAFSEMLNNAIEHSGSKQIVIDVSIDKNILKFSVSDSGIGVFRNIMQKKGLESELEAIQDLTKGKTTTMPKSHSGEGIFFTSKVGDMFVLDSFDQELIIDNRINDLFLRKPRRSKKGTRVTFALSTKSSIHLQDIFRKFSNVDDQSDYGFDKTEIKVRLYTIGGVHVSRSQARRILAGLDKFKSIIFDFDRVPMIGQAFADEIFRVFHLKYPKIHIEAVNMNEGVQFMVNRVETDEQNQRLFITK